MANDHRQQARRVFMEVGDLPEADRQAALISACGGDATLRAEVEALLQAEQQARGFMTSPTGEVPAGRSAFAAAIAEPLREGPGTRIGPYKILQLIGEGGFGSVYMAEQEKPVSRRVALKIIKLGMDTRAVIARFEAERQALAMMDHPNIARVLDAGATATGRPYFVMDLVKGDTIVEYCDKSNLSIEDRLELFAQVSTAVQHAHTKGIVHRDLKPGNILVGTHDGRAQAKVIDFGIAKAMASRLTEKTHFTEHKALIGTPEYMSPEQAEGSLDIDTRTDVYSLGVLLYELLTGSTPFSGKELRSVAYAEIQRIIREVDPPKPSTRLSQNTDTLASVAARRHTAPRRLGAMVRGDLDWIVMKALEKDRTRRYETANLLAMDLRRYLAGEAVVAAPPSAVYRVRKFVRRHRAAVTAVAIIGATLLMGIVGTTVGFAQARSARIEADSNAQRAVVAAQQARTAQAVALDEKVLAQRQAYSANMLGASDAIGRGESDAARQPLDSAPADLRGWEWRHLASRLNLAERAHPYRRTSGCPIHPLPDGRSYYEVLGDPATGIQRRDIRTGELLRSIPTINATWGSWLVADGTYFILAVQDAGAGAQAIELWDLERGSRLSSHAAEGNRVFSGDAASDGTRFAYAWQGRIHILDTGSGTERVSAGPVVGGPRASCVRFQPDGRRLVAFGSAGEGVLIDTSSLAVVATFATGHGAEVRAPAFSPDGRLLATATWDRVIQVTDVRADPPARVFTLAGPAMGPHMLRFSPDGSLLAACGADGTLRLWDTRTGVERGVFAGSCQAVAFLPDGQTLISGDASGVRFWEVRASDTWVLRGHSSYVYIVLLSPDGGTVYSGGSEGDAGQPGSLRIWDAATGEQIAALGAAGQSASAQSLSPDGSLLALRMLGPPGGAWIDILDAATGATVATVPNTRCTALAFDPRGDRLFWADSMGVACIADARSGLVQRSRQLPGDSKGEGNQWAAAWRPDGATLAAWHGRHPTMHLLDGKTLETIRSWPSGHTAHVVRLAFSPDGRRFATASYDGIVKIWGADSGELLHDLVGHVNRVLDVAFSPDGNRIATGGDDRVVHIWDARTYDPVARLAGHQDYVHSLAWRADSQMLISGSGDKTVRIWETQALKDRKEARRARQAILVQVEPMVQRLFGELGDTSKVVEWLRADASLSARARQIALQIVFRTAIERRAATSKPTEVLPAKNAQPNEKK